MKASYSFPNIGNYNVFNTIDNNYIIKKNKFSDTNL